MSRRQQLWVLLIEDTNGKWSARGPIARSHWTRHAAEAALADYVRRNWASEMERPFPDPDDKNEGPVASYFEAVAERYRIFPVDANPADAAP